MVVGFRRESEVEFMDESMVQALLGIVGFFASVFCLLLLVAFFFRFFKAVGYLKTIAEQSEAQTKLMRDGLTSKAIPLPNLLGPDSN